MNAKILVVDDEKDLLELLKMALVQEGYAVRTACDATEALSIIKADRPDLILLDVLLPDISGIRLTTRLKNDAETAGIPIILLTAKDGETDIIVGLSVGADDYITKPFSMKVLLARMEVIIRRAYPEPGKVQQVLAAGPVRIFPSGRQVFVQGLAADMTEAEYLLLVALVEAQGQVLSRKKLIAKLRSTGLDAPSERLVDVHIAALRKKLGKNRTFIRTVHGLGYRTMV